MRDLRILDKLVDDLAKGKAMEYKLKNEKCVRRETITK
jgi:hypothetical protein